MKSVAVLLVVAVLAHCLPQNPVDYRLVSSQTQEAPKQCTKSGTFCESCTSLVACVEKDHNFTKKALGTCKSPEKCLNGACATVADPICDGITSLEFPCQTVGIFPDPFYCNKFVLCVDVGNGKLQSYLNECQKGFGYNAETDLCDVLLQKDECLSGLFPVPICQVAGQNGTLFYKNGAMFYMCEEYSSANNVLYPFLDVCPGGLSYPDVRCVPDQLVTESDVLSANKGSSLVFFFNCITFVLYLHYII